MNPLKIRLFRLTAVLLIVSSVATPAFAVNKDLIQLQTQVQQLLDAVARLQQSNDERMGVLKDLVQQNSDSVNRMSVTIDALQKQIAAQSTGQGAKIDTISGQIQALNDSLDELKTRMSRLEKAMGDVSNQQQSMSATIQNLQPPAAGTPPNSSQPAMPVSPPPAGSLPPMTMSDASSVPPAPAPVVRKAPAANQPLVDDMYKSAFNDFMAAHYQPAESGFKELISAYPDSQLAGNAWFYIGEIDYRGQHYSTAVKDYDHVIEQYSDNNKVPAAHLHKGQALIDMQLKDGGIRELRTLIQRFPNSPEAGQAKAKLRALNVPVVAPSRP